MKRALVLFLATAFTLIAVQVVSAKGGDKITISGDKLAHDIAITDNACILNAFSDTNLEDLTTRFDQPPAANDLGDSYLITRYTKNLDGSYDPFDQVRYYTDPAGGLGYVHYLKSFYGDTAYDGEWFRPTEQTAFVLQSLIGEPATGMPDKVVISSGGLPHDIEITTDKCTLSAMAVGNLEDPSLIVNQTPKVTGSGYLITRYVGDQIYDQARFYRDAHGGRGYVYDLGRADGQPTDSAGKWFRPTEQSQYVMEQLLLSPSTYNGSP